MEKVKKPKKSATSALDPSKSDPPKPDPSKRNPPKVKPNVIIELPTTKPELHSDFSDSKELSHTESFLWEDIDEGAHGQEYKLHCVLSRTSWLIEDYRRFKAARVIQAALRGWFTRHMLIKKRKAAIVIQTEWRRFYAKRFYYRTLENMLQQRIEAHYFRSAQRIQALFRGWWIRMYVHDHYRLAGLQITTAEELLHCIAFKLHHLLRTHQIPGVYSFRNSKCLSKVEKLLTTISFKQHNNHVRWAAAERAERIGEAKERFKKSSHATAIPFSGPNLKNYCDPKCCPLYSQTNANQKMYKILSLYERAGSKDPHLIHIRQRQSKEVKRDTGSCHAEEPYKSPCDGRLRSGPGTSKTPRRRKPQKKKPKSDFCTDVVESMKRWNILTENNLDVDPNIFKTPEKLEQFLEEIESIYDIMQDQCHCQVKSGEMPNCSKAYA